jgi:hypothetical protein
MWALNKPTSVRLIPMVAATSAPMHMTHGLWRQIGHVFKEVDAAIRKIKAAQQGDGDGDGDDAEQRGSEGEEAAGLHDDTVTMLFLLHERKKGDKSVWSRWLHMLPKSMPNLVCCQDDFADDLQGTPAWNVVEMERSLLFDTYQSLFPFLSDRCGRLRLYDMSP